MADFATEFITKLNGKLTLEQMPFSVQYVRLTMLCKSKL